MIRDMSDKATVELAAEMIRLGIPQRDAISLAMACDAEEEAIELVGKKGYIHGWIFVGAPGAEKPVAPDDVQPHDLIRLAQKHARHLPSGVSLGGATKGQIVRAIQKGQREEGKRPASPAGPASGVKPPAARTAADVHRANGFSRAFADAIAPPPDGSHGFGAADPRRTAACLRIPWPCHSREHGTRN